MEKLITAAEANRHFSSILRMVREGTSVVITSHGRPVAKIVPADDHDVSRDTAWRDHLARLRTQPTTSIGRWTRDEIYEE